jgi:deazaflavin-dependent oxidoreductase (nitroreductase family)
MRYKDANWFQRLNRKLGSTRVMAWFYARTLHHLDRLVFRLTRQRMTFGAIMTGLPVVVLETTGAKTGKLRRTPLLGIPDGENVVVTASNWGQKHHASWQYNLRANPAAAVTVKGVRTEVRAREASGEERERLWQLGQQWYPGWPKYEQRAGNRSIPIFVLEPARKAEQAGAAAEAVSGS